MRDSAGPGERESAALLARRLEEAGALDARVEPFRYQRSWGTRHLAHSLAGILAAGLGGVAGATVALAALASFDLDFSGRRQWLARWLQTGEGANALALVPAAGERKRTLVLVAHHDAAQTGFVWRHLGILTSGLRSQDAAGPLSAAPEAALGLAAAGCLARSRRLRAVAAALLAGAGGAALDVMRSPTVPGANDNATGVAAVLALVERFARDPLPGTEVVALLPGCEESGMGGMAAWLAGARGELEPGTTLVLNLDTLGSGGPVVLTGEGRAGAVPYRDADLGWADGGAERAGLPRPRRFRLGAWTDGALAVFAGLPTISIASVCGDALARYHLPSDTPDRVAWGSVERCALLAAGIADAWSRA